MREEIKTQGYVLRRTNYGEADRILNLITPVGKVSAIVKGARKAKSRLAGGVEMFTLSDYNIHFGRGEMGTVTSAKMVRYYGEIVKDLARMELAGEILRKVSRYAEGMETSEYFEIVDESLAGINDGMELRLVEAWGLINILRVAGEEVNLYRDDHGEKLVAGGRYEWNWHERAFCKKEGGRFGADEIKMMRLMVGGKLSLASKVKADDEMYGEILELVKNMVK